MTNVKKQAPEAKSIGRGGEPGCLASLVGICSTSQAAAKAGQMGSATRLVEPLPGLPGLGNRKSA